MVDCSAFFDGAHDRIEAVVGEDHIGGFFGDVRAFYAHCDADICAFEGGCVVDAVACDGNDFAQMFEGVNEFEFVLWADAGENDFFFFVFEKGFEFFGGNTVEVFACDYFVVIVCD